MNPWMISIAVCAVITVLTRAKKALTLPAALTADAMLLLLTGLGSLREALALVGMYLIVFAADMLFGKQAEAMTKEIYGKTKARSFAQVMANGSAGCCCILLLYLTGKEAFLIGYYASIFEVMADSIASDVGVLSRKAPRDIVTLQPVSRGISGGVSPLGLGTSGLVCLSAALAVGLAAGLRPMQTAIVAAVPWLGMLTDSVMGSRLQLHYRCPVCGMETEQLRHCGQETVATRGLRWMTNSRVNLLCTLEAAVLGVLFTWL